MGEGKRRRAAGHSPLEGIRVWPATPVYALPVVSLMRNVTLGNMRHDEHLTVSKDSLEELSLLMSYAGDIIEPATRQKLRATFAALADQIDEAPCDEHDMVIFDPLTGRALDYVPMKAFMASHVRTAIAFGRYAALDDANSWRLCTQAVAPEIRFATEDGQLLDGLKALHGSVIRLDSHVAFFSSDPIAHTGQFLVAGTKQKGSTPLYHDFMHGLIAGAHQYVGDLSPNQFAQMAYLAACLDTGAEALKSRNKVASPFGKCADFCDQIDTIAGRFPATPGAVKLAHIFNTAIGDFNFDRALTRDEIRSGEYDVSRHTLGPYMPSDDQDIVIAVLENIPVDLAAARIATFAEPVASGDGMHVYRDQSVYFAATAMNPADTMISTWESPY